MKAKTKSTTSSQHTLIGFANPYLVCDECTETVRYWHTDERCTTFCKDGFYNYPCEHTAGVTSKCPSWSPVDGCRCTNKEEHDWT